MVSRQWEHISTTQRRAMLALIQARDGPACWLCHRDPADRPSIDHRLPVSRYPHLEWDPANWCVACLGCNAARGNRRAPTDPAPSTRWAAFL